MSSDTTARADDARAESRTEYRQPQKIARYLSHVVPPPTSFFSVPFRDVSKGGFSFATDRLPGTPFLVVAMQAGGESTIYMKAKVVHHHENAADGEPRYVVGCQFVGRMS